MGRAMRCHAKAQRVKRGIWYKNQNNLQNISSRKGAKSAKVNLGIKSVKPWKNLLLEFS